MPRVPLAIRPPERVQVQDSMPQCAEAQSTVRRSADSAGRMALLRRRAPEAEGRFWCSVVTTGVYCRPTCPARRARAKSIRFHDTLEEARATGFRPCGRCRPEEPSLRERHQALAAEACRRLQEENPPPSNAALIAASGYSAAQFHRIFRRVTGTTPARFARLYGSRRASRPFPAASGERL